MTLEKGNVLEKGKKGYERGRELETGFDGGPVRDTLAYNRKSTEKRHCTLNRRKKVCAVGLGDQVNVLKNS